MSYTVAQPAAPRVGGAPALPLQRRPFIRPGTYPGLGALTWDQFKAVQGGERTYTDGGVIIWPEGTKPTAIVEPPPPEPVQFVTPPPPTDTSSSTPTTPTIDTSGPMITPLGPDYSLLPGLPLDGGGGGAPINVSVSAEGAGAQPAAPLEDRGFGMVEAALGAAVAALLAMAWQRRK